MATRTSKKASPSVSRGKKGKDVTVPRVIDGAPADPRLERLKELVRILEASTLAGLQYEDQDIAVQLSRQVSGAAVAAPSVVMAAPAAAPAPTKAAEPAPKAAPPEDRDMVVVRSPFVGTFYSSPSPEAEPFSEVGKRVRRGQTLCIIEAMKLMNEIESEVDGTVVEIIAENGKPVQYGDALFKIKKST